MSPMEAMLEREYTCLGLSGKRGFPSVTGAADCLFSSLALATFGGVNWLDGDGKQCRSRDAVRGVDAKKRFVNSQECICFNPHADRKAAQVPKVKPPSKRCSDTG